MIRVEHVTRLALLASAASLIVGCGRHAEQRDSAPKPASDEVADPIPQFIEHLRRAGIVLEADPEFGFWWKVVEPPAEGAFDVVVSLEDFPPGRTPSEMEQDLLPTSLAYQLNAPARLAMSYPCLQSRPGAARERAPDPESLPISKRLVRLFRSYQGPRPFTPPIGPAAQPPP